MTISATTQGLRMGVATSSSRPTVPFDGQVISETDTDSLKVYNGTSWIGVGGLQQMLPTSVSSTAGSISVSTAGTVTMSAVTQGNINGCFTNSYTRYLIIGELQAAGGQVNMRLRVGGVENTSALYNTSMARTYSSGTLAQVTSSESATSFANFYSGNFATDGVMQATIVNPYQSGYTNFINDFTIPSNSSSYLQRWFGGSTYAANTSFDGFGMITTAGTLSGTVRIYAYV